SSLRSSCIRSLVFCVSLFVSISSVRAAGLGPVAAPLSIHDTSCGIDEPEPPTVLKRGDARVMDDWFAFVVAGDSGSYLQPLESTNLQMTGDASISLISGCVLV